MARKRELGPASDGRQHRRPLGPTVLSLLVIAMAASAFVWVTPLAGQGQQQSEMRGSGTMPHGEMKFGGMPPGEMPQSEMMHGKGRRGEMKQAMMEHGAMAMPKAPVWADPKIKLSAPPLLMGKQMGRVNTLGVPPLGYEMEGDVKVFKLIAQPVRHFLNDGQTADESIVKEINRYAGMMMHHGMSQPIRAWGYNGSMPGPTIEVTEGDRIRVILKNELPEPTSIHWHGIELPNEQDGAGGHTESPTMPGETHVYEFTLYQTGTFMYHTGFNVMKQDGMGLGGLLVVHPKRPKHRIDKDFAIMLQEWALLPGNENPNLVTMDFNWFTFNGLAAPNIPVLTVKQGERVRIRIGNLSMDSHPIHIHGYAWKVVGTEGGPIAEGAQWSGSTINVAPGTTRDVEFVAWNPGVWRFHCHKLHHIMNAHADVPMGVMPHGGMFTLIHVVPREPGAAWKHPKQQD